MIRSLEELAMAAWPALETVESDGWVLRFSEGYTRRANSVLPLQSGVRDLASKIAEAESLYEVHGLVTMFKMTSESAPEGLEAALADRDYEAKSGASIQIAQLAQATGCAVEIRASWDASQDWRDAFHGMGDIAPERRVVHDRILSRISSPVAYASVDHDGRIVGCALGVLQGGWLGVFDVIVDEGVRRQGYGERLMRGLMAWGCGRGAENAYLQVMIENAAARALYDKLEFREAYQYGYRVRRVGEARRGSEKEASGGYGFSYQATRNGDVLIQREGRTVTHLRHGAARDFLAEVDGAAEGDAQETMARYTGNYRRGNERLAARHPRNRKTGDT